jgi:hypothetical protein
MTTHLWDLLQKAVAAFCLLILATGVAQAAWSSGGGGEIIKDARNPWFLQNTPSVDVCIIHDAEHFDIGALESSDLEEMVQDALSYWKYEFSKAFTPWPAVRVATQRFRVVDLITIDKSGIVKSCAPTTDLTIQFGYLNSEQQNYLRERGQGTKDFISFAIRTSYDPVNLRGKGFIYFAADSGDLKFEGPDLVTKPWSMGTGGLIHAALKHELGHVFGIPHMGSSLMNAGYLEQVFKTGVAATAATEDHNKDFFKVSRNVVLREFCQQAFSPIWSAFVNLLPSDLCYQYKLAGDSIDLKFGPTNQALRKVGSIKMAEKESYSWVEAVRIYLTEKEDVFHDCPQHACDKPWLLGPMIKISERSGQFVPSGGGQAKPVIVSFSPLSVGDTYVKFSGLVGDNIVPNLEWWKP